MLALVLIAPHLASPKLVLRFLPKDVYEAGKDHPAPSLPKQILCLLLLSGNPGVQRMEEPGMEQ